MTVFTNVTYDELSVGQSASLTRTLTSEQIQAFALVTHDYNPAHLDEEYANNSMFKGVIGHGMWAAGLISALLGTKFPGLGTIYLNQSLSFRRPVYPNDTLTATLTVRSKDDEKKWVTLACEVTNQDGKAVVTGEAQVIAPSEKISREAIKIDDLTLTQQFSQ